MSTKIEWKDARKEPPELGQHVIVLSLLGFGPVFFSDGRFRTSRANPNSFDGIYVLPIERHHHWMSQSDYLDATASIPVKDYP